MDMLRRSGLIGLALLGASPVLAGSDARVETRTLEQRVLAELNRIRTGPEAYLADLRQFRSWFHGPLIVIPGRPMAIRTQEGPAAVDEALAYTARQHAVPGLISSPLLAAAAADHVAYLANGEAGHFWRDGTGPWDRVRRHGGGGNVGEIISFGMEGPDEVARQFIVDDGVPGRGHRNALFDAGFRYAGVACGPHPRYRAMCVVDLSRSPDGR